MAVSTDRRPSLDVQRVNDAPVTSRDEDDESAALPCRLLLRPSERGKQSKWNISVAGQAADCWADVYRDPFHRIMALPMPTICLLFAATYVLCWFAFAPLYMAISEECDLDADSYRSAVYYSIIVMTTIGFGTPDMTFNGCWSACWVIMAQTLLGVFANAAMVGTVYSKISRGKQRAGRITFSSHACLRKVRGNWQFMFQVVDTFGATGNSQLIEAHVRCFAIRHVANDHDEFGEFGDGSGGGGVEGGGGGGGAGGGGGGEQQEDAPVCFQQCAMRLSRPDDQMGSTLLLELPTLITHRIDNWSPLMPPPGRALHDNGAGGNSSGSDDSDDSGDGDVHGRAARAAVRALRRHDPRTTYEFPELPLRADDADGGGRSSLVCLVCGEAYDTKEQLALHCASCAVDEVFSGHHVGTVCRETGEVLPSLQALRRYCEENDFAPPDQQRPKNTSRDDDGSSSSSASSEEDDEKDDVQEGCDVAKEEVDEDGGEAAAAAAAAVPGEASDDKKPKKKKDEKKTTKRKSKVYKSLNDFDKNDPDQRRHSSMNHLEYLPLVDDYHDDDDDDDDDDDNDDDDGDGDDEGENHAEGGSGRAPARRTGKEGAVTGRERGAAPERKRRKRAAAASRATAASAAEEEANEAEVAAMERYFRESELEVVVVLEAIESVTSCTVQSRFSYSFPCGDFRFNATFVPSVTRAAGATAAMGSSRRGDTRSSSSSSSSSSGAPSSSSMRRRRRAAGGHAVVDLERFHRTRRVAANAAHFRDAQAHA